MDDKVEVKPTWGLAWGLWWRMTLFSLGACFAFWLILFIVCLAISTTFTPW